MNAGSAGAALSIVKKKVPSDWSIHSAREFAGSEKTQALSSE
jgi:hypothetical protein